MFYSTDCINDLLVVLIIMFFQLGQVRMTTTHCNFCEDLSILYAQDVVPGETKILVLNEENKLIPVIVDDLTIV